MIILMQSLLLEKKNPGHKIRFLNLVLFMKVTHLNLLLMMMNKISYVCKHYILVKIMHVCLHTALMIIFAPGGKIMLNYFGLWMSVVIFNIFMVLVY